MGPAPIGGWPGFPKPRRRFEPRQGWEVGERLGCRPGPVDVDPVGTGLEIPAESAGMEMKTLVEGQTGSGKTDQGASQDWANSSGGGVWE